MRVLFTILFIFYFGVIYSQACPVFPKPIKKPNLKHGHYLFMGFGYYSTMGKVNKLREGNLNKLGGRAFMPSLSYYNHKGAFMLTFSPGYDYGFSEPVIYGAFSYRIFPQ